MTRTRTTALLILLWVLAFGLVLGWKPPFAYNAQRYFEICLSGLLACAGFGLAWQLRLPPFLKKTLALLIVVSLISVLLATGVWLAVREMLQYTGLVLLAVLVAKTRAQAGGQNFDHAAYLGITLLGMGCALILLEGLAVSLSGGLLSHRIVFAAFVNVRYLAELMFVMLPLLVGAALLSPTRARRSIAMAVAMLCWGWLLLSGTRSALIIIPFALFVLVVVVGRQAAGWLRVFGLQLAGGAAVFLLLRWVASWFVNAGVVGDDKLSFVRMGTSGRLRHWQTAWEHFLDQPWWGQGPGSFACFTSSIESTPHNLLLQILSEWGLVITLLLFILIGYLFWQLVHGLRLAVRKGGALSSYTGMSLFMALTSVAVAAQMEGMIVSPLQQMLIVLVSGWAMHWFAASCFTPVSGPVGTRWREWRYLLVLLLFLAPLLFMTKADLVWQRMLLIDGDGVVNLTNGPRYWLDGHDHCLAAPDGRGD